MGVGTFELDFMTWIWVLLKLAHLTLTSAWTGPILSRVGERPCRWLHVARVLLLPQASSAALNRYKTTLFASGLMHDALAGSPSGVLSNFGRVGKRNPRTLPDGAGVTKASQARKG